MLLAHYKCYCPVQKAFPRIMAHRIYTHSFCPGVRHSFVCAFCEGTQDSVESAVRYSVQLQCRDESAV